MGEIKSIKAVDIFPLISEIIAQGNSTRISVKGSSMYPFLRDEIDSVEMSQGSFDTISRGDIVLIKRTEGVYVMHRVLRKTKDSFFIVGDAQQWIEGPLYPDQLVALVTAVWRRENRISCNNRGWRFLSVGWLLLRPVRYFIFKVYGRLRKLI